MELRITGSGVVEVDPIGETCSVACTFDIKKGAKLVLRPISRRSDFARWEGSCASADTCSIEVRAALTLHAVFESPSFDVAWAEGVIPGTGSTIAWDVKADPHGDLFVAHGFNGTADFGDGSNTATSHWDVFLAKYDGSDGTLIWGQHVVGAGEFVSEAVDTEGNLVFAVDAGAVGKVAFVDGAVAKFDGADGKLLWFYELKNTAGPHVVSMPDDSIMIIGARVSPQRPDESGLFIARLGSDGSEKWAIRHDSGRHDVLGAIPVGSDQLLFIVKVKGATPLASERRTGTRILIALVDREGNTSWITTIRSTHTNALHATPVGETPEGVFISGTFGDEMTIGDDRVRSKYAATFLARLRPATGELEWIRKSAGVGGVFAFIARGRIFARGTSRGELSFGSAVLSKSTGRFVAELDTDGRLVWSAPYAVSRRLGGIRKLAFTDGRLCFAGHYSGVAEIGSVVLTKPARIASMIGCYNEPPETN